MTAAGTASAEYVAAALPVLMNSRRDLVIGGSPRTSCPASAWTCRVHRTRPTSRLRIDERCHAPPRALLERTLTKRVGQLFQVRNAVDHDLRLARVGRPEMEHGLTHQSHRKRPSKIVVVDSEQLDVVLPRREDAALDPDSLVRDPILGRSALEPEHEVRNADCHDHDQPLPEGMNDRRVAGEQLLLEFPLRGQR